MAVILFITVLVIQEDLADEIGELRDEIGALRAEIECRNQPDDCDVARGTAEGPVRPRAPRSDAGNADRETVLHIYTVEILYAAVVDGYIDWHKAIVEAAVRASLSKDRAVHFHGHRPLRERARRPAAVHERLSPGPGLVLRMPLLPIPRRAPELPAHHWTRG